MNYSTSIFTGPMPFGALVPFSAVPGITDIFPALLAPITTTKTPGALGQRKSFTCALANGNAPTCTPSCAPWGL